MRYSQQWEKRGACVPCGSTTSCGAKRDQGLRCRHTVASLWCWHHSTKKGWMGTIFAMRFRSISQQNSSQAALLCKARSVWGTSWWCGMTNYCWPCSRTSATNPAACYSTAFSMWQIYTQLHARCERWCWCGSPFNLCGRRQHASSILLFHASVEARTHSK
jgi:hypothetical protein